MRQFKINKSVTQRSEESLDKYLVEISRMEIISPEQEVELASHKQSGSSENQISNHAEKVQRALRHTIITKRVVKLFFENMTENDKVAESQTTKDESKNE